MDEQLPRGTTTFPDLVTVHFDGACEPARGGGVATYGFTVEGFGLEYEEKGLAVRPWSPRATNNVAEYTAAIRALEWLTTRGFKGRVLMFGDSQLIVRQMKGEYEVKAPHLQEYHRHLRQLAGRFEEVRFEWVPRRENARADALSKLAFAESATSAGHRRPESPVDPVEEDLIPENDVRESET
ncbi:MAG: ribonuclease HI [Thermoplasmata archaeon]